MHISRQHNFGDVRGWELGWSPVGRPMMTTICYRVGSVLIDTGLSHMRTALLRHVSREKADIEGVLLTHYHEDHSGNAAAIQYHFGIPVFGSPETARKMIRPAPIFPYQHLMWGASDAVALKVLPGAWEAGGLRIEPIHTPGHAKDHTAYLVPAHGWLFSGDLYLSHRIKYFRADECIADQIRSLKTVLTLDFDALFCAHNPQPTRGKAFIRRKLQYLEDFFGNVAAQAAKGMGASEVMRALQLKEARLIQWLCFGNVSMKHMVRSVLQALNQGVKV